MIAIFVTIAISMTAIGETKYKLLRSKNLDTSQGAKRTKYDIQVPANTGDKEIKAILKQAVKDLRKKREVDALAVHLYLEDSSRPYAFADWAPYGDWSKAERGKPKSLFKTSITILLEREPIDVQKVKKWGLSLEQRKKVYRQISRSQEKTKRLAKQKYPSDIMKQFDYMSELDKIYEKKICDKYNITDDQKSGIIGEGIQNNWPD